MPSWEIGRHKGLKILAARCRMSLPRAPLNEQASNHFDKNNKSLKIKKILLKKIKSTKFQKLI